MGEGKRGRAGVGEGKRGRAGVGELGKMRNGRGQKVDENVESRDFESLKTMTSLCDVIVLQTHTLTQPRIPSDM